MIIYRTYEMETCPCRRLATLRIHGAMLNHYFIWSDAISVEMNASMKL